MKNVTWRPVDRADLANLLTGGELLASQAVGAATIYRVATKGREVLALALPDGAALILEAAVPVGVKRRRRLDAAKLSPASR